MFLHIKNLINKYLLNTPKIKKKLYLHIGFEKTGTSSIQYFCFHNNEYLKSNHIIYPNDPKNPLVLGYSHWPVVAAFLRNKNFVPKAKQLDISQLMIEIKHLYDNLNKKDQLILSAEPFHSHFSKSEIKKIKKYFSEYFDIKIIAYIREQSSAYESYISTLIRGGVFFDLENFSMVYLNFKGKQFQNYSNIKHWANVFGKKNLICKLYINDTLLNNDITSDFFNIIDSNLKVKKTLKENAKLSSESMLFWNELNNVDFDIPRTTFYKKLRLVLEKYNSKRNDPFISLLSMADKKKINSYHEKDNLKLSKEFFDSKENLFALKKFQNKTKIIPLKPHEYKSLLEFIQREDSTIYSLIIRNVPKVKKYI